MSASHRSQVRTRPNPTTQTQEDDSEVGPSVSPHPQGLQGSHLNLSQISAQRHRTYFLLNNKAK